MRREDLVMAGRGNASLEALRVQNPKEDYDDPEEESESVSVSESESEDERRRELQQFREEQLGELRRRGGVEAREGGLETLASGPSAGLPPSSHLEGLQANSDHKDESEGQVGISHQELLAKVTAQAKKQLELPVYPTSSSELSPNSVTKSVSSASCATLHKQNLSSGTKIRDSCLVNADLQSPNKKPISTPEAVKASGTDGYNWRKYGQKQVKSPRGSRSYFRCTYSDCPAKKIECCDHAGHVLETVYRSHHNHDPPRKVNSARESRIVRSVRPLVEHDATEHSMRTLNDSAPSTSSKEPVQDKMMLTDGKPQTSLGLDGDCETTGKKDSNDPKRRGKKNMLLDSDTPLRPGKKPKFVVHAAGDVGISADGYRWRKYGQKMVKGNPHPRNYYRCTSAGCPIRKHIETAVDNASAVVITYKGIHDHDMPVPKKRHGQPNAPLIAATAPASMHNSSHAKEPDSTKTEKSTQWSVDTDGELTGEAMELGGEKAMESARTLLSIGFEIKPC